MSRIEFYAENDDDVEFNGAGTYARLCTYTENREKYWLGGRRSQLATVGLRAAWGVPPNAVAQFVMANESLVRKATPRHARSARLLPASRFPRGRGRRHTFLVTHARSRFRQFFQVCAIQDSFQRCKPLLRVGWWACAAPAQSCPCLYLNSGIGQEQHGLDINRLVTTPGSGWFQDVAEMCVPLRPRQDVEEARRGLVAMSIVIMAILVIESVFYVHFALDPMYLYTSAVLMLLSLNMVFSARAVNDPKVLHLLGITLLVICGSAIMLLAHYQHDFHPMLFASVAMLFIVVPMMPWGSARRSRSRC